MADVRHCKNWDEVVELFESRARGLYVGPKNKYVEWLKSKEGLANGKVLFGAKTYAICYNIYHKIKVANKSSDHFTVICGLEGSGKSTLAAQMGSVVSPTLNRDSVLYEPTDFLQAVLDSKIGDTIILDEGVLFLFSRTALAKNNVQVTKIFQLMRVKRLHIIICIPRFKNIDSEVRQHRCDNLIDISVAGKYRVYTRKGIQYLINFYPKVKNLIRDVRVKQSEWFDDCNAMRFPNINSLSWEAYQEDKINNFEREVKSSIDQLKNSGIEPERKALMGKQGDDSFEVEQD